MIQKEVAQKFDYNLPKMNKYKFLQELYQITQGVLCFKMFLNQFLR